MKNGRGTLKAAAQLLVQLSPTVLNTILQKHDITPCPLRKMLRRFLEDSHSGEHLSRAFEALLSSDDASTFVVETCTYDEDGDNSMVLDGVSEIHPGDSISSVGHTKSLSFSLAQEPETSVKIDDETTLDSFISSHGALAFAKNWDTVCTTPHNMSEALIATVHRSTEWRCIVWWVCILTYYQKDVTKKVAAVKVKEQQDALEKKKENVQEKEAIGAEKLLQAKKKTAERIAAAAVSRHSDIQQKLLKAKAKRAESKSAVESANTNARRKMANTVTLNHKKQILRLVANEKTAAAEVVHIGLRVEDISTRLAQVRCRSNHHEVIDVPDESITSSDLRDCMQGEKMPYALQDHWDVNPRKLVFAPENIPLGEELAMQWDKMCVCIMHRNNTEHARIVGEALWDECFDQLFAYPARKKQVEKALFYQTNVSRFVKIIQVHIKTSSHCYSHSDTEQITDATLATDCSNRFFWDWEAFDGVKYSGFQDFIQQGCEKIPFLPRYRADEQRRTFSAMDSIPYRLENGKHAVCKEMPSVYNCWPGFLIERCPAVAPDEVAALVRPILEHLLIILGEKQIVDYVVAWLAQIVQDPAKPTQVCPIFQGEQGIGKDNIFIWFIDEVLGRPAGYQTAKPHEDIFGKHSLVQKNCALALFDEISAASTGPIMDLLKNFITGGKHNLDPKHGKKYDVANFTNVMCTTTYTNPIVIASTERRFAIFSCRQTLLNDAEYFAKLGEHLEQEGVARAFFQYLRDEVNISSHRPFQEMRPIIKSIPSELSSLDEQGGTEANSAKYKHSRIRAFVSSGLKRIGCVKDGKTLKYLGVKSFETVTDHIQKKMDCYNSHQMGKEQMSFANIELDHIKPVKSFALDLCHYTNLQPLLKEANGQKSAKWTDVDELFCRTNIQHQPDFTCTYTGSSMGVSACIPPHPLLKQIDDISTCAHKDTSTSELPLPSLPSTSRLSLKERDPMAYASKKRKIKERLCSIFERDAVWEHIQTL